MYVSGCSVIPFVGEVITYWLIGATEKAIQRKPVDLEDMPPPLFCRPRRSPKLNCDSRQPSLIGAAHFGNFRGGSVTGSIDLMCSFEGAGSRRQSNIPRADVESQCSLQGSILHSGIRDSPRPIQKKLERVPLYLNEESHHVLEHVECCEPVNGADCPKKPLAMVKPRQVLRSIASSDEYGKFGTEGILRESRSLDPFPSQLRRRDLFKMPIRFAKRGSRSLEGGVGSPANIPRSTSKSSVATSSVAVPSSQQIAEHSNNNCNGSIGNEDVNCPLLQRQGSLSSPVDELLFQAKRWHSLESVAMDNDSASSKKPLARASIRSWLVGLFQGSALKNSDASLRKVCTVQSGVKPAFNDLPASVEKESIV